MCQIVSPGRTFIRRLFDLSCHVKYLHYIVKLSVAARADIDWWLSAAISWNQKSMFMDEHWTLSTKLHLHTDASLKCIGAVFGNLWLTEPLSGSEAARSIAWKELLAVVMACAMWGDHFRSKKLVVHCDNSSVVYAVNTGTSKCVEMMYLIRQLYHLCVQFNFVCYLQHYGLQLC